MAKITTINKSRKIQTCGKCHKEIPVGSSYLKAEPYMRPVMVRCTTCGLKWYETSSSDYIQTMGELTENWSESYSVDESGLESLVSDIEQWRDDLQERLDNMPEQLQEADTGTMLQERIEGLESALSELESIDVESLKSDALCEMDSIELAPGDERYVEPSEDEEFDEEQNTILLDDADFDDVVEDESIPEWARIEITQNFENALSCEIDDALGNIVL